MRLFRSLLMPYYLPVPDKTIELKLHSGAKMFPRVLLSLNVLDEFGFRPGTDPTIII